MNIKPFAERTHEKMKEVLMNEGAEGPEIYYYMIRGGKDKKNITVWETGTVGGEYIKAYGHYHITDFLETYWVIEGEGYLLLQARKKNADGNFIDGELESCEAIKVKKGDSITIPPFMGHLMINTGNTWLVTSDDSPVNLDDSVSMPAHADYEMVKKMRGFAYYAVEKEGKVEFVKNEIYKHVPELTIREL